MPDEPQGQQQDDEPRPAEQGADTAREQPAGDEDNNP